MSRPRAAAFLGFLADAYRFLRRPLSLDDALAVIRRQLGDRNERWLAAVAETVYDNPGSPYRHLLSQARCELGDLQQSVRRDGLEPTLRSLRDEGVHVSFDEFKGRTPIVRGDLVLDSRSDAFDNPGTRGAMTFSSGGSTGPGTSVDIPMQRIADSTPTKILAHAAHGVLGARTATWRPRAHGVAHAIMDAGFRQPHERWFAPDPPEGRLANARTRLAVALLRAVARTAGTHIPAPESVGSDASDIVARWAAEAVAADGRALLLTGVTQAVRLAQAAQETEVDVAGLTAFVSGEPLTAAKVSVLERAGVRWLLHYTTTEVGRIGLGCASPAHATDMHLLTNVLAITQHPRAVPHTDMTVDSFYFTSLSSAASKILINVESDDYGVIERRPCGCPFEQAGFDLHIRDIYSFGKLTGEGVTLVGSHVQHILENVLPDRFGGTALDYQLVEEEDEHGMTKLSLIVSPRVERGTDDELVESFFAALGPSRLARDVASIWRSAGTMRVRRTEPITTSAGKVLPLVPPHLNPWKRS